jgi:CRP/FNR family transcriptional regulator
MKEHIKQIVEEAYGFLFEPELMDELVINGSYKKLAAGDVLIEPGQQIKFMPLLLNGSVKIMRTDKQENEMLLYYIERGDTCAMSMSCCLGRNKSEILAVAEEDTELITFTVELMDAWVVKYRSWRSFVFESYSQRLQELLETIDSIAFMNMDGRLLKYLQDKVKVTGSTTINNTHQEIADELHTSRVVVSRLLKKLERNGVIQLHRNRIEVLQF